MSLQGTIVPQSSVPGELTCDSNNESVLYLEFVSLVEYLRYPTVHLIVASFHANYKNARQIIGIFDCKDHDSG